MAYIGFGPLNTFSPVPSKDSFTGDGSTTTFDLQNEVVFGGENALEVFVDNVRQEPGTGKAYTLDLDGNLKNKRITFSAAPASGAAIYVINDKTSNTTIISPTDLNGVEFILDADADTSITADTDDRIDFKLNGTDHIQLGTSSGDTTIKIATDAKDLQFLQADGRNILEINDAGYVALGNGATGSGQLRIYEDTDNGTNFSAFQVGSQSADITYTLPTADGTSGFQLTTDGSGTLSWAAAQIALANDGNNRIVTGTGSAGLNAEASLTFDGSTLAVTGAVTVSTTIGHPNDTDLITLADGIVTVAGEVSLTTLDIGGTNITSTAAEINILDGGNAASSVTLADADRIIVNDSGTMKQVAISALNAYTSASIAADDISAGDGAVNITTSSGNITIDAAAGDADIIFKGTDDSADITALTLDMSAAGAATFNDKIIATELDISGDIDVDGTTNLDIVDIDGALTQDGGAVFNEAGADVDFRIESSSNSGMFFVNAGASHVSVGTDGDFGGVFNVSGETVMRTTGNSDTLTLTSTDTDADAGPNLALTRDSSSPADDDILGRISFKADDDGGNVTNFLTIDTRIADATDGSEDFKTVFSGIVAGTERHIFTLGSTEAVLNDGSQDIDFRVESNTNTHAIFVEGSSSHIGINTSSPQSDLHITGSDTSTSVIIENTNADASAAPDLFLFRNSSSPADDDSLGNIEFRGKNDNTEDTRYVINNAKALDVSDGTEDGQIEWQLLNAGSFQKILTMNPTEVVINEDSGDTDFRVESNGQANAFKIDAGTDTASFAVPVDIDSGITIDNITIDGTEIDLSSGDLLVDVAGDITLDAGGGNVKVAVAGTDILDIANSSSDVIIKPVVDAKDIIFQQRDGTSVLEINDGAYARFTGAAVAPEATLTDASTVTWNALTQSVAKVTLGGNRTIGLASGGVSGAFISILVIQDGTGSRTVTWNAAYEFASNTAPTLTTTANLGDLFVFRYNGAKWLETGRNLALVLS